jgi:ABC-type transport system involved in multi-copper enzyme maturation permease subunit
MRTLLIRPISRLHLIAAKIGAACTYTLALSFFVVVLAVLLCYAVFQPGDLLSLSAGGLVIFSHQEAVARLALAYGLAVVGRLVIALVALMFSCLFDNGLTAAALTIAALIVFGALQQIPYFDKWEPYFLTWHLDIYRLPLQANPTWDDACRRILGLAAYSVAACGVAALAFVHRDIP